MKILIADDERPLTSFLQRGLSAEGFECLCEHDLHNVVTEARREQPEIVILDRMFGREDSLQILEALKAQAEAPMVLLLTAVDDVKERVNGLKAGADDYLCKPFDFDELLARVIALSRRYNPASLHAANQLEVGNVTLDLESRLAYCNGSELTLTKLEFDLLMYLAENINKVLSRERILSRVWKSHSDPLTNIVDVYISRLRKRLPSECILVLETLRGNGYRLKTGG